MMKVGVDADKPHELVHHARVAHALGRGKPRVEVDAAAAAAALCCCCALEAV
jgi:hypothetical protein